MKILQSHNSPVSHLHLAIKTLIPCRTPCYVFHCTK
uniref:Uncharacterized protein n=1 Tax=Rhizophora mucronata TaxID=61149 RepID=A0A2P2NTR9_RHIMU